LKKFFLSNILFLWVVQVDAQKDSISIDAQLSSDKKTFEISQQIVYHNHSDKDLNSIKLLNWTAAYNKRGTSLVYNLKTGTTVFISQKNRSWEKS